MAPNETGADKAPFPWFGGKSGVSAEIWKRLGNVRNYVEPFAGSLAVLLGRPDPPMRETVNDIDCFIANFWRALAADPVRLAAAADWPINEADLHARHESLITNRIRLHEKVTANPDFFDTLLAGWWVWGVSAWFGDEWCGPRPYKRIPNLQGGRGVHRWGLTNIYAYFARLAERLRNVRVTCGDWRRILTIGVTTPRGQLGGVLLDPPYPGYARYYTAAAEGVAESARAWAIANGDRPNLRIAFCGYEGDHEFPNSWECLTWKAKGGYGNQKKANVNARRERVWFSPHCLKPSGSRKQRPGGSHGA